MTFPTCEICQDQKASILICLEHEGQTEKHHICIECVGDIADTELAGLLNQSNVDFSKLKTILQQMRDWHEPAQVKEDSDEIATLQKLQAMMGDDADIDLDDLASQTAETMLVEKSAENESPDKPSCSECGTTWKNIHEDGLVGCSHCYVTFAKPLNKVMELLHHSAEHVGKTPRFRKKQQRLKENQEKREKHRLEMLQRRLDAAIQSEDYEEAAQIRDKIEQVSVNIDNKDQNTKNE